MYKLTISPDIIRDVNGLDIPNDSNNVDYIEYLSWLAEGNVPEAIE